MISVFLICFFLLILGAVPLLWLLTADSKTSCRRIPVIKNYRSKRSYASPNVNEHDLPLYRNPVESWETLANKKAREEEEMVSSQLSQSGLTQSVLDSDYKAGKRLNELFRVDRLDIFQVENFIFSFTQLYQKDFTGVNDAHRLIKMVRYIIFKDPSVIPIKSIYSRKRVAYFLHGLHCNFYQHLEPYSNALYKECCLPRLPFEDYSTMSTNKFLKTYFLKR